jgi:hypothetical protein
METKGGLYIPAALAQVTNEQDAEWAPQPACTPWNRKTLSFLPKFESRIAQSRVQTLRSDKNSSSPEDEGGAFFRNV